MDKLEVKVLKRHPTYAFHAISGFYPLSGEQLRKYRDLLFWDDVCENEEIDWSIGLVQTFLTYLKDGRGKLNSILHSNKKIPWSVEFIKSFNTLWYWDILGERTEIQNCPEIQDAFKKQLEPVNAWLVALREHFPISHKMDIDSRNIREAEAKQWSSDRVGMQKGRIDWSALSTDERLCDWNFEFLQAFERNINFDFLIVNRKAWVNCFGKLSEDDIDSILYDKTIQTRVAYVIPQAEMSDIDKSHYEIPECVTFEYFLKQNGRIKF